MLKEENNKNHVSKKDSVVNPERVNIKSGEKRAL